MAHELNEPLSSILGFAQLARRDAALPERAGQDIGKIVTASLHAREIIKKLLLSARQTPTFRGPMDLNSVILGAVDLFKHHFEKDGIELVCVLCRQMPVMTGCRKFFLEYLSRDDVAALTPEAAAVTSLRYMVDVDEGRVEEILDN